MNKKNVNAPRFTLRRPWKIILCALVNAVLLIFCFIEGGQWLLAHSAMLEAKESRVYLGMLSPRENPVPITAMTLDGEETTILWQDPALLPTFISEDALRYLEDSPLVREIHKVRPLSARITSKVWMPALAYPDDSSPDDANSIFMFVGRVSNSDPVVRDISTSWRGSLSVKEKRWAISPLLIAAGYPKHLTIPSTEDSGMPIIAVQDKVQLLRLDPETGMEEYEVTPGEDLGLEKGARYLFVVRGPGLDPEVISLFTFPGCKSPAFYPEEPGDEALSDEEFAAKVIRENGLEDYAAMLDNAQWLVSTQQIDGMLDQLRTQKKEVL